MKIGKMKSQKLPHAVQLKLIQEIPYISLINTANYQKHTILFIIYSVFLSRIKI